MNDTPTHSPLPWSNLGQTAPNPYLFEIVCETGRVGYLAYFTDQDAAAALERINEAPELQEWREYAIKCTQIITNLTVGGSEFFGKKIGDVYTADLDYCQTHIRERFERRHEDIVSDKKELKAKDERIAELERALFDVLDGHCLLSAGPHDLAERTGIDEKYASQIIEWGKRGQP